MQAADTLCLPELAAEVLRLGFGCCPMGRHGWGRTDEQELTEAVNVALDQGVQLFDTADVYGLGVSEQTLGRALGRRRQQAIIASKFSVRRENDVTYYDNSQAWLEQAVEASLRRLGTEVIDLYQVHYWDRQRPVAETLAALDRLRQAGKIRAFGVTNIDLLDHGINEPMPGLVSCSFEHSLVKRRFEARITALCDRLGLVFLSWGSLGQGLLSGKYDAMTSFGPDDRRSRPVYESFHGDRLEQSLAIVAFLRELQPRYPGRTLSQLALRWIIDTQPGSIPLVGIKRPDQLLDARGALGWRLAAEDLAALDKISA